MTFIDFDICNLPATLPVLYSVTLTYFDLLISHRSAGSCSLLWALLRMLFRTHINKHTLSRGGEENGDIIELTDQMSF